MFAINLILSELEKAILLHGYLHEFWYITPNRKNIKILIHFQQKKTVFSAFWIKKDSNDNDFRVIFTISTTGFLIKNPKKTIV